MPFHEDLPGLGTYSVVREHLPDTVQTTMPAKTFGPASKGVELHGHELDLDSVLCEFNVLLAKRLKDVETFVMREFRCKLGCRDGDALPLHREAEARFNLQTSHTRHETSPQIPAKSSRVKSPCSSPELRAKAHDAHSLRPLPSAFTGARGRAHGSEFFNPMNAHSAGSMVLAVGKQKSKARREILKTDVNKVLHESSMSNGRTNYLHRMSTAVEGISHVTTLLNCLTLGISLDIQPNSVWWWVAYAVFTFVFAVEQIVRACMERRNYLFGAAWKWNVFEAVLVLVGIADVVVTAVAPHSTGALNVITRLLRVARLGRLVELAHFGPLKEMVDFLRGTLAGMRCLFWACLLMLVPVYAVSIFFRETLGAHPHEGDPGGADMFYTVPMSFYTVFSCAIAHECLDEAGRPIFHLVAHHHGWHYVIIFSVLHFFMEFSLFNVIHALFVEQVLTDAESNTRREERELLSDMEFFAQSAANLLRLLYDSHILELYGDERAAFLSSQDEEWLQRAMTIRFPLDMVQKVFNTAAAQAVFVELSIAEEDTRCLAKIMDIEGDQRIDASELLDTLASIRGSVGRADMIALTYKVDALFDMLDDMSRQKED